MMNIIIIYIIVVVVVVVDDNDVIKSIIIKIHCYTSICYKLL